ncbi:MAG: CHAP domain-containing protein [Lachnospiraceae bacterium]|nr:CHAP domain-containing protein [Lachnospiraceae bacterium]
MTTENLIVLAKIITAVESGGQVYGQGSYDDVTMPGTNSKLEKTVTLGAGQFYGSEAHALVSMIRTVYPATFKRLDTAKPSIESMMAKDWVAISWAPNASQKKALKALISSEEGKSCQDTLLAEQMAAYVAECVKSYPADIKGQMMYAEIRHLGGKSAADRIFKRLKAYDLDSIMAALKADQADKSSDNQVGDLKYWTRHIKCYEFIEKYAISESTQEVETKMEKKMTKEKAIAQILETAKAEEGYLEKGSARNLDSKTANAGSGNYTKYWRDIKPSYQGAQWCLAWCHWVFWKAFGKSVACKLLRETASQFPLTYCPDMGEIGKSTKALYTKPQSGDIVLFWKKREDGYRFGHAGLVISATDSTVTTIEGNTSSGSAVVPNGGGVYVKTYKLSDLHSKTRYYRPDWSAVVGAEIADDSKVKVYETNTKLTEEQQWVGEVTTLLNVRTGPGKEYSVSQFYPLLAEGDHVGVCDEVINAKGEKWYYIIIQNDTLKAKGKKYIHDFVKADYIKKA